MDKLSENEVGIILFCLRNRLRYESQRKSFIKEGIDIQNLKVWELKELIEKVEAMPNAPKARNRSRSKPSRSNGL